MKMICVIVFTILHVVLNMLHNMAIFSAVLPSCLSIMLYHKTKMAVYENAIAIKHLIVGKEIWNIFK